MSSSSSIPRMRLLIFEAKEKDRDILGTMLKNYLFYLFLSFYLFIQFSSWSGGGEKCRGVELRDGDGLERYVERR